MGKLLVKKSFRYTAFVKDLSMAKINMPMDDQVLKYNSARRSFSFNLLARVSHHRQV